MKRVGKRILGIVLSLVLVVSIAAVPASATVFTPDNTRPTWMTTQEFRDICNRVEKNLEKGILTTTVDISSHHFTKEDLQKLDWDEFIDNVIHNLEPFRSDKVKSGEYFEDLYEMQDPVITTKQVKIIYARRLTKEQEQYVDQRVNELAKQFTGTDEQKISQIFSYLYKNYPYDDTRVVRNRVSIPKYYTDYDALRGGRAQCQSFAFLFYRLTRAVGIKTSYLVGGQIVDLTTGNLSPRQGNHAWNRVDLNGTRYYYDCASASYDYHRLHILTQSDPDYYYEMPYSFFQNSTDYNIMFDYGA